MMHKFCVSSVASLGNAQAILQNGQQIFLDRRAALRRVFNAVSDAKHQIAETDLSTSLRSQQRDRQRESSTGRLKVHFNKLIIAD